MFLLYPTHARIYTLYLLYFSCPECTLQSYDDLAANPTQIPSSTLSCVLSCENSAGSIANPFINFTACMQSLVSNPTCSGYGSTDREQSIAQLLEASAQYIDYFAFLETVSFFITL
jgi:hypothetical protein